MIDSHCHLTNPHLLQQIEAVIERAKAAGVTELVTIGTDPEDASAAINLCERFENVRCAIGIHPNESQNWELSDVNRIAALSKHKSVVAIGEIGLDYFHKLADRGKQRKMFEAQLAIAEEREKPWPVVIHCREAVDDALAVLRAHPKVRCVFHCFTGTMAESEAIIAAGHYLGFTGPITFKKNDDLREIVKRTPIERILVETDSPYLTPEPVRKQKICEPAFVAHTLEMVARVKEILLIEANEITTKNTREFYRMTQQV